MLIDKSPEDVALIKKCDIHIKIMDWHLENILLNWL